MDLVTALRLIVLNAAYPEFRDFTNNRPAVLLEPFAVSGHLLVLPLRGGNVGVHVDFAEDAIREVRCVIDAGLRISFPWIHGPPHAVLTRALASGLHRPIPEHHDGLGTLGMQKQQCRKDPRVAIPECMSGIV